MKSRIASITALITTLTIGLPAQSKQPPTVAEWGQFEQLSVQPRGGLSPDGQWVVYGISRSNRDNELRIRNVASGDEKTVPFATSPAFSNDSKWIAYAIGFSEAQEERLRTQRRPAHRKLGLLKLDGSSSPVTLDGIESFAFDPTGGFLMMRRYAPERPATGGAAPPPAAPASPAATAVPAADDPAPVGVTILVRDLATGRDVSFGNVAEVAWPGYSTSAHTHAADTADAKARPTLAFTVSAEDKIGNGIYLYDAATGMHRALDSSTAVYTGLTWRRDADDLVVLRAQTNDKREGSHYVALAWKNVSTTPKLHTLEQVPPDMRTVSFRRPSWSEDGRMVFVGIAPWAEKVTPPKPPTPTGDAPATPPAAPPADETSSVDIWHARDIEVMPRQKLSATADRRRNYLSVWHLESGKVVQLTKEWREQVALTARGSQAYVSSWPAYAMDRTIGRFSADVSLVDVATGERTKVLDRIDDSFLRASPNGKYLLFMRDGHFWTLNTATRAVTNLTKSVPTAFIDRESDVTSPNKPAYGIGPWTKDDAAVLLYDKFDMWEIAADGSKAKKLTDGATEQVRHRYARLDLEEEFVDTSKPFYVSLFGLWSKKSGYARVEPGARVTRVAFEDKSIGALAKARDANVLAFTRQSFDDSPDLFIGADITSAKQVTTTNPFLSKYAWGRAEVVEYKSDRGERLQGALFYPAGYEPGKRYPMVVYLYEKLSDGVHRFVAPSERDYYNASAFTSNGYIYFMPDIVFRPREPGLSVVECVEPAVKKVIAMGVADPARVGVVGHSWGGFDAAYLATHSNVFAAAVAGAAITDLVSNYGNHHWSSGIAETDHIETGQQRMEVPLYEDLQAYIRNSAVFNVHNMKTPLMLMTGDNDGTVHWHQAVEMYNIARRAKKQVVMLAYGGEDHGLRRKANQIDYQRRILQWFGHYLKNEPASKWITEGLPFLERDAELKKSAPAKKGT